MRTRKVCILAGFLITWSFVTYYFLLRSTNNNGNISLSSFSNYNSHNNYNNKLHPKLNIPQMRNQRNQAVNQELKELELEINKEQAKSKILTNNVIRLLEAKYIANNLNEKAREEQFVEQPIKMESGEQAQPNGIQEPPAESAVEQNNLEEELQEMQQQIDKSTTSQAMKLPVQTHLANGEPVIPILVFSCNRVTVAKCIDNLLLHRKSKEQFPIIVSQDCGDEATKNVILSYKDDVTLIEQPDLSDIFVPPREKKFKGYYKIARHYGWALNTTFQRGYDFVVIVEDDLNVAPDFFEYFHATYPLLKNDSSLWCVSAWNDNGKENYVDPSHPELLYRTDFFPGLGWMLSRELWQELSVKWPKSFWDDWIRQPQQRQDRVCIRPEISRTKTFGKIGVSNGLFFDKYLKHIKLDEAFVPFTKLNLSYLLKDNYDRTFLKDIYTLPIVTFDELRRNLISTTGPVRIQYTTRDQYKRITKLLGLMDDLKSGVPRTAYHGIVSFFYNKRRVHLAPNQNWKGYDVTWS